MNVTKCLNGHFFDSDKYDVCPHCGASADTGKGTAEKEKKAHKSLFSRKEEKKPEPKVNTVPDHTVAHTFGLFASDVQKGKEVYSAVPIKNTSLQSSDIVKEEKKAEQSAVQKTSVQSQPIMNKEAASNTAQSSVLDTKPFVSAQEELKQISAIDEGKTVGYFSMGGTNLTANTATATITEPVVGWLVCVKGAHFGQSFNIVSGRNSIGRAGGNHIIFSQEPSVSREKHAWITYEPKKREFYIQPGESSGLTYLNGDNIMAPQKMNGFDKLELGEGVFILVPFCGENFTWEDYMNRSNA